MSIYGTSIDPESCDAHKDEFTGNVHVRFEKGVEGVGFHALEIDSPTVAHAIRAAVNKGVDIYLQNQKKGL